MMSCSSSCWLARWKRVERLLRNRYFEMGRRESGKAVRAFWYLSARSTAQNHKSNLRASVSHVEVIVPERGPSSGVSSNRSPPRGSGRVVPALTDFPRCSIGCPLRCLWTSCIGPASDLIFASERSSCSKSWQEDSVRFVLFFGCLSLSAVAAMVTLRIQNLDRKRPHFPPI
jgi:hypothetical protein